MTKRSGRLRLVSACMALGLLLLAPPSSALFGKPPLQQLMEAIVEIDLGRAREVAARTDLDTPQFLQEKARLLVHLGDCVGAMTLLSNPAVTENKEGAELAEQARSCARATAAGFVIEDAARGIWLRVQDDADRTFAPFLFEVAAAARDRIGRELSVDLPRPLRIDLVRDLFSLSAVSGLPLTAAETTGTLAVARFGRVIMLSPRATRAGYHWEDTLAHELTHLLVTRATRDRAPLWLQEGVAKREEVRWREARPFDPLDWANETAFHALVSGRAIGIDKLGPSIAMLPTPEAAATAYAEVQSFVEYFVAEAGAPALRLLFADLRGLGGDDVNQALRSGTGYDLPTWNQRWQKWLAAAKFGTKSEAVRARGLDYRDLTRRARLSDLLLARGHAEAAAVTASRGDAGGDASFRFRVARAELARGRADVAAERLGTEADIDSQYGPWFGLRGRLDEGRAEAKSTPERSFRLALSLDPLAEEAACEGGFRVGEKPENYRLPSSPAKRQLCEDARALPRD